MMKPLFRYTLLLCTLLLCSSCSLIVNTVEGSESRHVAVIPKKHAVANVSKVTTDLSDLPISPAKRTKQKHTLHKGIINQLKEADLYQNGKKPADTIRIIVKRINDDIDDRRVQAYVQIFGPDDTKQPRASAVFVETGKGLRRISYVRKAFIQEMIDYLKKN